MKTTNEVCRFIRAKWHAATASLVLAVVFSAAGADIQLPVLKTRTGSFENVTVTGSSKTDIYITHSRGMTNIKIADLDPESSQSLGYTTSPAPSSVSSKSASTKPAANTPQEGKNPPESTATATTASFSMPDFAAQLKGKLPPSLAALDGLSSIRLSTKMVLVALGLVLTAYLFVCYCLKLICDKTGQKPGPMVWCPILQMFPLLRAAGMPGWWFIGFLLPFVNIAASILWSFKIVKARGKSVWVAIGLLLPITSLFAFLYLAFSNGGGQEEEEVIRSDSPLPPLLAEA